MRQKLWFLAALLALALPSWAGSGEASAFDAIFTDYDAIRASLAAGSIDGMAERAGAIAAAALDAEEKAKKSEDYSPCCDALGQIVKAADELAATTDLTAARAAFGDLSKPMIRYREHAAVSGVVTVYCPMKDVSWLQRDGEAIGNPYMGPKMARCGQVQKP